MFKSALLNLLAVVIPIRSLPCELYMANSLNRNFGRGIFAGRSFRKHSVVEQCPTFSIHNDFAMNSQLEYFVYASDEASHAVVVLGAGMMYNSLGDESVSHDWATKDVPPLEAVKDNAHTTYTDFSFTSEKGIRAGEELFANYGDKWFDDRNIVQTTPGEISKQRYDMMELEKVGHCLSDIAIEDSPIPMAGKGVFAKKSFPAGSLVSISPVVILSRKDIYDVSDSSVLINYCISQNNSDVALLPMGRGAMMNHGGVNANVKIEWHQWDSSVESRLSNPVIDIMSLPFSPLDIQYTATRDISEGEELLLSYGPEWEEAWLQHLTMLVTANANSAKALREWEERSRKGLKPIPEKPQFRTYITAPSGLFPEHFNLDCVGFSCGKDIVPDEGGDIEALEAKDLLVTEAMKYAKTNFLIGSDMEIGTTGACADLP